MSLIKAFLGSLGRGLGFTQGLLYGISAWAGDLQALWVFVWVLGGFRNLQGSCKGCIRLLGF